MVRSPGVEFGEEEDQDFFIATEAHPRLTVVELARLYLTEPLILAIKSVSGIDSSRGATDVQCFLDPLKYYSKEETHSPVPVAPSLRDRNCFGILGQLVMASSQFAPGL